MNREEAKQKLWATGSINTLSKVECDNLLNEVYDDFDVDIKLAQKIIENNAKCINDYAVLEGNAIKRIEELEARDKELSSLIKLLKKDK